MTTNPGIDYGMGRTNVDRETGIRFGVVNANRLPYIWDDVESVYPPYTCPECEAELGDDIPDTCPACEAELDCDDVQGQMDCVEALFHKVDVDGVVAEIHSDGDMFILKSPVYIYAQFCSPCAPGAGHIENPCPSGVKTYALPMDWFGDDDDPPYTEADLHRVDEDEPDA